MILVDSNILLDILTRDPVWENVSRAALAARSLNGRLFYIDVIFAEVSIGFPSADACARFFGESKLHHAPMSPEALWLAGQAFQNYRRRGTKTNVLPDFFIGAQASVIGAPILTRDSRRYAQYFPDVALVVPDGA